MEKTPTGTPVGVDDPYEFAGVCDHLTGDGRCRYALERAGDDLAFAAARRVEGYACVASEGCEFRDCRHYRSTASDRECVRCGLEEVRIATEPDRPLLEEHHLSYGSADGTDGAGDPSEASERDGTDEAAPAHEITVVLCRWCHSKVHNSFARIDDDANPDVEALAAREERRSRERAEFGFASAADRWDGGRDGDGDGE